MKSVLRFLDDCTSLVYPRLCLACLKKQPASKKEVICTHCNYYLPKTHFHLDKENNFTERFWGRIQLHTGAAIFQFSKGSGVQKMLHNLKYKGQKELGIQLGKQYGKELKKIEHFKDVDCIVPVPLHPSKRYERGYNQSEIFADGLSEEMKKECIAHGLARTIHSKALAKQSRADRLLHITNAFRLQQPERLRGKHILLVDDVLTTGATLEACATKLLQLNNVRVSMATIAITGQ